MVILFEKIRFHFRFYILAITLKPGHKVKKRNTYLTIIFCLASYISFSQSFQKTYGGIGHDGGYSIDKNLSGEFVVAGSTILNNGSGQAIFLKINSAGDTLWTKSFGDSTAIFYSVERTFDNGFIGTGITTSGAGSSIFLEKTDASGNTQWTKKISGINSISSYCISQTADSGYIITGASHTVAPASQQIYLIKTNSIGDTLWTRVYYYGLQRPSSGNYVQQTQDGGFIVAGYQSYQINHLDMILIKTDSIGNHQWTKTFRISTNNIAYCIRQTQDGGFIIASRIGVFGIGTEEEICLIKTDGSGSILWTSVISGAAGDVVRSVMETSDKGFILAGNTFSFGAGSCDACLIKTDSTGNITWAKLYGGTDCDVLNDVTTTANGGYISVGNTRSFGAGDDNIYIIKTDSLGNSGCNENNSAAFNVTHPVVFDSSMTPIIYCDGAVSAVTPVINTGCTISTLCTSVAIKEVEKKIVSLVSPNPSSGKFSITADKIKGIEIYNLPGVKLHFHLESDKSRGKIIIDLSGYSNGIYFAHIITNSQTLVEKLVLHK